MTDAEKQQRQRDENNEFHYIKGSRAAWVSMLNHCLRSLGVNDPESDRLRWISEREETVAKLRELCYEFGDNDWPNNLHLADVIEKHIHVWDADE